MNTLFWIGMSIAMLAAALLVAVFRRAMRATVNSTPSPEWVAEFRPSRYRPMQRLLRESEFVFLSAQPGFEPAIARRLRSERRRILREYLKIVRRDFDRFYALAKALAVQATEDRSDFMAALVRQRVAFAYALMSVELKLALHVSGARLDFSQVTNSVESLRLQIQQLSPAGA